MTHPLTHSATHPTDPDLPMPPLPIGPDSVPDPDIMPEPLPETDPMPTPTEIPVQDPALPTPGEVVPPIHS